MSNTGQEQKDKKRALTGSKQSEKQRRRLEEELFQLTQLKIKAKQQSGNNIPETRGD